MTIFSHLSVSSQIRFYNAIMLGRSECTQFMRCSIKILTTFSLLPARRPNSSDWQPLTKSSNIMLPEVIERRLGRIVLL